MKFLSYRKNVVMLACIFLLPFIVNTFLDTLNIGTTLRRAFIVTMVLFLTLFVYLLKLCIYAHKTKKRWKWVPVIFAVLVALLIVYLVSGQIINYELYYKSGRDFTFIE